MDNRGYTLAEALTALVMIGLAMAGAGAAIHLLSGSSGRMKDRTAAATEAAQVQHAIAGLPPDLGPFKSDGGDFSGGPASMSFDCRLPERCAVESPISGPASLIVLAPPHRQSIALNHLGRVQFAYLSARDGSIWRTWPDGRANDRLGGVALAAAGRAVAFLDLPRAQPDVCGFDLATGQCRKPGAPP
jgi:hypothetical protein